MTFPLIESLVPHRGTMLRLDKLTAYEENSCEGSFFVKEDDPFLRDGCLREESVIETLAQTVAAGQGLPAAQEGKEPSLGYLTGVESFRYSRKVISGETVETKTKLISATGPLRLMECSAFCGGELVAEGILKFYIVRDKQ